MSRKRFAPTKGYSFAAPDDAGERRNDDMFLCFLALLKSLTTLELSRASSNIFDTQATSSAGLIGVAVAAIVVIFST